MKAAIYKLLSVAWFRINNKDLLRLMEKTSEVTGKAYVDLPIDESTKLYL